MLLPRCLQRTPAAELKSTKSFGTRTDRSSSASAAEELLEQMKAGLSSCCRPHLKTCLQEAYAPSGILLTSPAGGGLCLRSDARRLGLIAAKGSCLQMTALQALQALQVLRRQCSLNTAAPPTINSAPPQGSA